MRRSYQNNDTLRITSSSALPSRIRRVRVAWFVCGVVFGMVFTVLLQSLFLPEAQPVIAESQLNDNDVTETSEAEIEKKEARKLELPATLNLEVGRGDTLLNMLVDTGVTYEDADAAMRAMRKIYDPRRIYVGQELALDLEAKEDNPERPQIKSLSLPLSVISSIEIKRDGKHFAAEKIKADVETTLVKNAGPIRGSFYQTAMRLGLPAGNIAELMKAYSYDVDFQRDLHPGHKMEVLMERLNTKSGEFAGYGDVLYASLILGKKEVTIYRYTDKKNHTDYFNAKGESLRKALLRTPINGARITSNYGMRRHPILGYSRMHKGMDFGAASGTPIYAAGDGTVDFAGRNGGYGNYLRIKHTGKYSTAYAHTSKFAKGVRKGVRVKQGQVVAYVGSTGRSTGPHLHYELLANGTQVNPKNVEFKTGRSLSGTELTNFKKQVSKIEVALNATADNQKVAQAN